MKKQSVQNSLFLPEGYDQILEIDLIKNKKIWIGLNVINLLIMVGLIWLGHRHISILELLDIRAGLMDYLLKLAILVVSIFLYLGLHEWVHGLFFRLYSGRPPHYGFGGGFAYAGSDSYFNRRSYLVIGLAPIVVWGIVLGVLCICLPEKWFWNAYFIQTMNLAGSVGDLYVTIRLMRCRKDILIFDTGTVMTIYGPVSKEEPKDLLREE